MARHVLGTLFLLGGGAAIQRLCQLATLACVAGSLGVEGTGRYAQGMALAAVMAMLAGSGIRSFVGREIARQPDRAGGWLRAAVRGRLLVGAGLLLPAVAIALVAETGPWFWILCAAQVLPAAFDSKGLLDAVHRSRLEVAIESAASVLLLGSVVGWMVAGSSDLTVLAAIVLATRCAYALGAAEAMRRLPVSGPLPSLAPVARSIGSVSVIQMASEIVAGADVLAVAWIGGEGAAGLYALAQRIAAAACVPSVQLGRLLLPHVNRAPRGGDLIRTTRTALRSTAWATLPMAAGGMVVAEPLCALLGQGFAAAAPALRLLLIAVTVQHLGWQCSHALFALGRERAYALGLLPPVLAHCALLPPLVLAAGAAGASLSAALAQSLYLLAAAWSLRKGLGPGSLGAIGAPMSGAVLAGAAAFAAAAIAPDLAPPLPALVAGASAFAAALWALELRGRLHRLGEGLSRSSGFGAWDPRTGP